jgi:hypothetical protein
MQITVPSNSSRGRFKESGAGGRVELAMLAPSVATVTGADGVAIGRGTNSVAATAVGLESVATATASLGSVGMTNRGPTRRPAGADGAVLLGCTHGSIHKLAAATAEGAGLDSPGRAVEAPAVEGAVGRMGQKPRSGLNDILYDVVAALDSPPIPEEQQDSTRQ